MATVLEALKASREFEHTIGHMTFRLRLPTDYAVRKCWKKHTHNKGELDADSALRETVHDALIGWEGVTDSDILGHGVGTPEPYSAALALEWFDVDIKIADELAIEIWRRYDERKKRTEGVEKN